MSLWGLRAAQRDEGCLRLAVEERLLGWTLLLFAIEGCLQSLLHKAFPHACNGMGVHRESASNLLITPGRSIRIRFEEHAAILILEIKTYQAWGQAEVRVGIRAQAP